MKVILRISLAVFLLSAAALAAEEGRFFTYPTISGDKIAFSYESDLWVVGSKGGLAARLTTFPGTENFAKFSPDGKWLAFTATYDGAPAVYLMPAEGGAPVRLTYNPGGAQVVAWTPDGASVVFRSMFENVVGRDPNLYKVGVKGGAPERLPLDRGVLIGYVGGEDKFLYVRRGNEEYYWKRYKGGQYTDIWLYDFTAKSYAPITDYVGKNAYPMWIGDTVYFTSDRGSGITNIFAQKIGAKEARPVTAHEDLGFWGADEIQQFWSGKSFLRPDDGNMLSYDLARILVDQLSADWPRFATFVNDANLEDAGAGAAAVVVVALRFAAIASSSSLMPSCEMVIYLFSDSVAASGLWKCAPLEAVHHSQLMCASKCFSRAASSALASTPRFCASSNLSTNRVSQNSALRALPAKRFFSESIA